MLEIEQTRTGKKIWNIFVTILVTALSLMSVQSHADNLPSLQSTFDFIVEKLRDQSEFSIQEHIRSDDGSIYVYNRANGTLNNLKYNLEGCTISFQETTHGVITESGSATQDISEKWNFKFINDIQLVPLIQYDESSSGYHISTTQPAFVLILKGRKVFELNDATGKISSKDQTYPFYFSDESIADRVGKAVAHAAKLCGGLNPEPF